MGTIVVNAVPSKRSWSWNPGICASGELDGVVDFDAAVRDPEHPTQILAAYDSGDKLHPNDAGYRALGESIDLSTVLRRR